MTEMTGPAATVTVSRRAHRWAGGRWALVASVVASEALLLSFRFDARQMGADSLEWYAWPLAQASMLFRGAAIAALVAATLGGGRLLRELAARTRPVGADDSFSALLGGNAAAFAALVGLSMIVLNGGLHARALPAAWLAAWLAAGLATAGFALAAVLPPSSWWPLVRGHSGPIAAGLAAAFVATTVGQGAETLWAPLANATLRVVVAMLGLFEPTVLCRPAEMVVGTPTFEGIISPTCSGFEGIGMTTALLAGYLWYDRAALRFPVALLLLPLGVASIWVCNCARIAALILIGSSGYPAVAQGGFHSQAGWLAFNAVGLGTIALARFRVFRRDPAAEPAASESNPVVPYVVPLMALLIAMMATAALSPGSGLDRLYPARVAALAVAFWSLRRRYAEPLWSLSWAAPAIGLVVFVVWMALEPIRGASADPALNPWKLGPAWASAWLAFRIFGSVVTVPMAEELAFRGFLLRRLVSADFESAEAGRFSWPSFLGSSLLFGAMHGRWVAGTLAGAAYALAVYRRGRLSDAVVAHATTNALIAAYVISTGNWSLWS